MTSAFTSRRPVRPPPDQLVSQIAAGEVVERPASVVKELLENTLDAGATQIQIKLEEGGVRRTAITDNGIGIPADELPVALMRHATSKIGSLEGLESAATLGFRGEALASIASVMELTLTSRTANDAHATQIIAQTGWAQPASGGVGTTVDVQYLYLNTPARRRFLKTEQIELGHYMEVIRRTALARPDVVISVRHNGRPLEHWNATQADSRFATVLGTEFTRACLPLEESTGKLRLLGFVGLPTASRGRADYQFFYVNGRFVRDRLLTHTVRSAYEDVLHGDRFLAYVLCLELPSEAVDVNVHPSKIEVRFRDSRAAHQFVCRTVQRALSRHAGEQGDSLRTDIAAASEVAGVTTAPSPADNTTCWINQMAARQTPLGIAQPRVRYLSMMCGDSTPMSATRPARMTDVPNAAMLFDGGTATAQAPAAVAEPVAAPPADDDGTHPLGFAVAQLHGIYVLAQSARGMVFVDMHATHECILYEQLKTALETKRVEVQPLLIPVTFAASPVEIGAAEEFRGTLTLFGLDISTMSPTMLAVRSVPTLLQKADAQALVHDVLHNLHAYGGSCMLTERQSELLAMLTCRSVVRTNRRLNLDEMNTLLRRMEATEYADQYDHGRPTWIQLTVADLNRLFLRGQ